MTVRVTTLKGAGAGAYYVEALPNYYLDADEPRGMWAGRGAAQLGLTGVVDDAAFLAVMAGADPSDPERRLGLAYMNKSVRGFDVTASAPKSVSVLWALGGDAVRAEVLAAHDAAVDAMCGWIEQQAHTRYRVNGEVMTFDAEGVIAARFRQHTSRALDPQLHTHVVIANRVMSPDGRWLAFDARMLKRDQRTLSAIYHAALRAELTRRLGVTWGQVVNGIADVDGVNRRVAEVFSSRTRAMQVRLSDKLDRFVDSFGREPNARERWQLEREAAVDSRPAKDHAVNASILHDRWAGRVRDLGLAPERVVSAALDRIGRAEMTMDGLDRNRLIEDALDALCEQQSSWRPAEIVRELAAVLPSTLQAAAADLVGWVDEATHHHAVHAGMELGPPAPAGVALRASDGRPVTEGALDRAITQWWILEEEAFVLDWAANGLGPDHARSQMATLEPYPAEATAAQEQAAAAIAGSAPVVLVVGPAGTGKTTAMRPAFEQLCADGRIVFGVAPSAIAAMVLTEETGVPADTIDKLLAEHRTGHPRAMFDLPAGATVIVDEAGMLATSKLAELIRLAVDRAWRVALVGDPFQFSAVGRGGMFGTLVDAHGGIELDRVHRFTNDWERAGSLQLRRGDPTVADLYDEHGRLHGGTAERVERSAVTAWWRHRSAGESTLLMAPSNDTVGRLNELAQHRRIIAGDLAEHRYLELGGGVRLHVGDEIATRHNDRTIETDRQQMVRNRNTWTITAITGNGAVEASGETGNVILPPAYVAEHVELAYAVTSMGAQGRTVEHAITVLDGATDVRNIYVPMTRGRESNHAYIATGGEETAAEVFARYLTKDWIDLPAHQRAQELWARTGQEPDSDIGTVRRDDHFGIEL